MSSAPEQSVGRMRGRRKVMSADFLEEAVGSIVREVPELTLQI